jgi:hypothetical protein
MTINGTLEQVVSELLEGTHINYALSRGESGKAATLDLLGQAPEIAQASTASADQGETG